jgi:hypothetical protein
MESYHRQPHAKRADNKLKTAEESDHCPPSFQSYRTHFNRDQKRKNHVQSRHPPQAGAQINCTGPTLHTAEPHTEEKYDPARQRNSQRPSTLKINRTRDECNKKINTHKTPPTYTRKKNENPTRRETMFNEKKTDMKLQK